MAILCLLVATCCLVSNNICYLPVLGHCIKRDAHFLIIHIPLGVSSASLLPEVSSYSLNQGKDVFEDEQLVPFWGRCSVCQYIPLITYQIFSHNLGNPWCGRLLCMEDVTLYGETSWHSGREEPGKRVVLEMTKGLKGVIVICDNFLLVLLPGRGAALEEGGYGRHQQAGASSAALENVAESSPPLQVCFH